MAWRVCPFEVSFEDSFLEKIKTEGLNTMKRYLLLVLALACGGGNDDSGSNATDSNGQCSLDPGDYVVDYSVVSDTCDYGDLPSELFTVTPDGTVGASVDTPDGCSDSAVDVIGCSASYTRKCALSAQGYDVDLTGAFSFDFIRGSGTVTIRAGVTDPSTGDLKGSCSTSQRAKIERLK